MYLRPALSLEVGQAHSVKRKEINLWEFLWNHFEDMSTTLSVRNLRKLFAITTFHEGTSHDHATCRSRSTYQLGHGKKELEFRFHPNLCCTPWQYGKRQGFVPTRKEIQCHLVCDVVFENVQGNLKRLWKLVWPRHPLYNHASNSMKILICLLKL